MGDVSRRATDAHVDPVLAHLAALIDIAGANGRIDGDVVAHDVGTGLAGHAAADDVHGIAANENDHYRDTLLVKDLK
ncbi:hypothetical protein GCM10027066_00020 [Dyella jejuensis]